MRHEAWSDGSFFPVINRSAAALLEPGATLLWTVDAASWEAANALYHKWRGWKPYVPMDDDPVIYTPEQEVEAACIVELQTQHDNGRRVPSDDFAGERSSQISNAACGGAYQQGRTRPIRNSQERLD